ncbi:methyltransferase [Lithospermum erythrorhizon]|uniref:Methyltransferase n=1 Tax=Lithospermum erythrorhizon TaxID=34254 RepID=A0AAV3RXW2_LITER
MVALFVLESSPVMLAPWHELSSRVLINVASAFEGVHGEDVWKYAAKNPAHQRRDGLRCSAFGVRTLVDVGGGNGTTLSALVKAFPWIHGINFDLPHVVSTVGKCDHVVGIAGDMFKSIPKADAIFIKWVLHDWSDDECIQILKNCREAIPKETGKVIIAEAVIDSDEEKNKKQLADVGLMLDMVMMAHTTKGKERTSNEWTSILKAAGFNRLIFKNIEAVQSVILAYP